MKKEKTDAKMISAMDTEPLALSFSNIGVVKSPPTVFGHGTGTGMMQQTTDNKVAMPISFGNRDIGMHESYPVQESLPREHSLNDMVRSYVDPGLNINKNRQRTGAGSPVAAVSDISDRSHDFEHVPRSGMATRNGRSLDLMGFTSLQSSDLHNFSSTDIKNAEMSSVQVSYMWVFS